MTTVRELVAQLSKHPDQDATATVEGQEPVVMDAEHGGLDIVPGPVASPYPDDVA